MFPKMRPGAGGAPTSLGHTPGPRHCPAAVSSRGSEVTGTAFTVLRHHFPLAFHCISLERLRFLFFCVFFHGTCWLASQSTTRNSWEKTVRKETEIAHRQGKRKTVRKRSSEPLPEDCCVPNPSCPIKYIPKWLRGLWLTRRTFVSVRSTGAAGPEALIR